MRTRAGKRRREDGSEPPVTYGKERVIQQPKSLLAGTDVCVATGKPIPLTAPKKADYGVVSSD